MGMHCFRLVWVAHPDAKESAKLAEAIVESRLAACVTVIPGGKSVYRWKDKIEHSEENLLLIKTGIQRLAPLIEFVKSRHPYECPEIVSVTIDEGDSSYLRWLEQNTAPTHHAGRIEGS